MVPGPVQGQAHTRPGPASAGGGQPASAPGPSTAPTSDGHFCLLSLTSGDPGHRHHPHQPAQVPEGSGARAREGRDDRRGAG